MADEPVSLGQHGKNQKLHTLKSVALAFGKLGLTSFGGPTAHLGYFRSEFVERKKWISDNEYASTVALCQALPGPTSSQVGFAIGLKHAGYGGALVAFLAFTLPTAFFMIAAAAGLHWFDGTVIRGAILGLKAVAVAVVIHALIGMARQLTPDLARIVIAVIAIATLQFAGPWGNLAALALGAGIGYIWLTRSAMSAEPIANQKPIHGPYYGVVSVRAGVVSLAVFALLLVAAGFVAVSAAGTGLQAIAASFRSGALVFGGGHVVLPMLQAEPSIGGEVAPENFLAGYALAQAVPGPLFTVAGYLGFLIGGLGLAVLCLLAIFAPGFLLVVGATPFWEKLQTYGWFAKTIAGVNAAVVGILAYYAWDPMVKSLGWNPGLLIIATLCFVIIGPLKRASWIAVTFGASAGIFITIV